MAPNVATSGYRDAIHEEAVQIPMNVNSNRDENIRVQSSAIAQAAYKQLSVACRIGDFDTAESIITSTPELDINVSDEWNYTPLILASLCGHKNVVQMLLSRGAVCDRDTLQGARCIYGALNDEIRNILVSFDISKKDAAQPFASHMISLLNPLNELRFCDIVVGDICMNRFVLALRSAHFRQLVTREGDWAKKTALSVPGSLPSAIFKAVIDYLYIKTDTLPLDRRQIKKQMDQACAMFNLDELNMAVEAVLAEDHQQLQAQAKTRHLMEHQIVKTAQNDLQVFVDTQLLPSSMQVSLESVLELDLEELEPANYVTEDMKQRVLESETFADILLAVVDAETMTLVLYPAHRAILARSEYFATMFKSDLFSMTFPEAPTTSFGGTSVIDRHKLRPEHVPVVRMFMSALGQQVAEIVLHHLYRDYVHSIPPALTVEVLYAADELFLDRLKRMCAVNVTYHFGQFTRSEYDSCEAVFGVDVYQLMRIAWATRSDRIEHHISQMLAHNLGLIVVDEEEREKLIELVRESAHRIKEREDVDTIEVVDDMRYYITKKYGGKPDETAVDPVERDNDIIDTLLREMGLDA